jgi:hypothetical protein
MSNEILAAIIAVLVSVLSAVISIYGQTRTTILEHRLARQREAESREEQTAALIARYRNPLLRAAYNLQSRLYNIVQLDFYRKHYSEIAADQEYTIKNTLYVVGDYLGWVEILRRDVQFLDLGDIEANRQLETLMGAVTETFLTDELEPTFRLFRGEQRAAGEVMLIHRRSAEKAGYECIGYSEFVAKLDDARFAHWFARLEASLQLIIHEPREHLQRLTQLQHALVDLIDFLDPDGVRIPKNTRLKADWQDNVK